MYQHEYGPSTNGGTVGGNKGGNIENINGGGVLEEHRIDIEEITDTFSNKIRDLLLSYLDDLDNIKRKVHFSLIVFIFIKTN